jgi:hypothetical protein
MGLDREKKSPEFKNEQGDIEYVPTFIFFRNGQELGRIIESPIQSLEKDLRQIILGT